MCGLYGLVFHADPTPNLVRFAKLFSHLAQGSAERGWDATGMARIDVDGYSAIYKNCQPSWEVVKYNRWMKLLCNMNPCTLALLGHTRYGTHGANIMANAHPFKFIGEPHQSLIGTHNGMIFNHEKWGPERPFDNDSANLFHGLANRAKADWLSMLEKVTGSFAVAFSTPGMVHFTRNMSSPLELLYLEQYEVTVYASTWAILQWALDRSKIPFHTVSKTLPTGELWTYTPDCSVPVIATYLNDDDYCYNTMVKRWAGSTPETRAWHSRDDHEYTELAAKTDKVPTKAEVEKETGWDSESNVECDRCATWVKWSEIVVPSDRNTCLWCAECAEFMQLTEDYYSGIDPVVCVECGREVRFQDTRLIGNSAICLVCAGHAPEDQAWIMCDNCTAQFTPDQVGKLIHYIPEISTHICVNCQDDPTNPFCVPMG